MSTRGFCQAVLLSATTLIATALAVEPDVAPASIKILEQSASYTKMELSFPDVLVDYWV